MTNPNSASATNTNVDGKVVSSAGALNQITCIGFYDENGVFVPGTRYAASLLLTIVMGEADLVPRSQKTSSECAIFRKCDVCPNSRANRVK